MSASQCMWLLSPPRWAAAQSFLLTFHQSSTHVLQRSCFHSFVSDASHTRNRWRKKKKMQFSHFCLFATLIHSWDAWKDLKTVRPDVTGTDLIIKAAFTFTQRLTTLRSSAGEEVIHMCQETKWVELIDWLAGWLCHHSTSQHKWDSLFTN